MARANGLDNQLGLRGAGFKCRFKGLMGLNIFLPGIGLSLQTLLQSSASTCSNKISSQFMRVFWISIRDGFRKDLHA